MQKREATRIALGLVLAQARVMVESGEFYELLVEDPDEPTTEKDAQKVINEVLAVAGGLERRMVRLGG